MFDSEKAKKFVDAFGDDAYRFAYIITLSKEAASEAVCGAFAVLVGDPDFDPDRPDKKKIFFAVYKAAKRSAGTPDKEKIEAEYGQKCGEFYEVASLPLHERAKEHLVLYEGYEEKEAEKILRGAFDE